MRLFPWKLGFVCEGSGTGHVWRILVLHTGLISGRMLGHSINSVRRSWLNRNKSNYFPVSWFKNTLGKDKKKKSSILFLEISDNGALAVAIVSVDTGTWRCWVIAYSLWMLRSMCVRYMLCGKHCADPVGITLHISSDVFPSICFI